MFEPLFAHFGPIPSAALLLGLLLLTLATPLRHLLVTARVAESLRARGRRVLGPSGPVGRRWFETLAVVACVRERIRRTLPLGALR